jgi:short-subunit dehydrogenase involved in D-alanine esterification of teichoic acids
LAKKIAEAEYIIQTSEDQKEIAEAEQKIVELSGRVNNLEDITIIDEMVQEILGDLS